MIVKQNKNNFSFLQQFDFIFEAFKDSPLLGNFWIAGGCFESTLREARIKDIDLFVKDKRDIEAIKNQFSGKTIFESDWIANILLDKKIIQIVKQYQWNSPEETLHNFDFTVAMGAYDGENFYYDERFFLDIAQKRLVINRLIKPLNTFKRSLKYSRKGYVMCPVNQSLLIKTIHGTQIDWENPDQNVLDFYPDGTPTFRGVD